MFLFLSINHCYGSKNLRHLQESTQKKKDSTTFWIKKSKDKSISNTERLNYLNKAANAIQKENGENIKPSDLSDIAYRYYQLGDTLNFLKVNEKVLKLANKRKDSFIIADAHWSYGVYYLSNERYK